MSCTTSLGSGRSSNPRLPAKVPYTPNKGLTAVRPRLTFIKPFLFYLNWNQVKLATVVESPLTKVTYTV